MKKISQTEFHEMRILGYIDETKNNKNFTICNKKKSGKCKSYFVTESDYEKYKKYL